MISISAGLLNRGAAALALFLSLPPCVAGADQVLPSAVRYTVIVGPSPDPLELYAASELRKYLRSLYGIDAGLANSATPGSDGYFIIGNPNGNPAAAALGSPWPKVSDQGIVLKSSRLANKPAILLGGGSPAATLWAVYEFVQRAGVRFLLEKDVLPLHAAPFPPPHLEVVQEPTLPFRSYRGVNDLATSLVFYGIDDYRHLIDQLAKLKFNVFYVSTYPSQPFVDYEFRGQAKTTGVLHYGWKLPIHSETIGRGLFGGRTEMSNPEFEGARTYRERVEAGSRLLHEILRYAHSRGMKTGLMFWINQFTPEFERRLPEWSDRKYIPMEALRGTRNARLGVEEDGVDPVAFPYMTPTNPVVMELNRAVIAATVAAYPEVDFYGLNQPELPKAGDEYKQLWARLNRKYHLEPEFDLDNMMESARTNTLPVGVRQGTRPVAELKAAIAYADTLDRLINEDKILEKSANPNAALVVSTFSDEFYPVVARIFRGNVIQMLQLDYLSSLAARRTGMLAFAAHTPMKVEVMATLADDNIGILPQLPTPSLNQIFEAMKQYHVDGFFGRQFLVTKLEAATTYIAWNSWSDHLAPDTVYRDQVAAVCGDAAVEDMLNAYHIIERATLKGDEVAMGFLFPVPTMMQRHWRNTEGPRKEWDTLADYYRDALPLVVSARAKSRPEGYSYLDQLIGQLRFSAGYIDTVQEVRRARLSYEEAVKARQAKDVTGYAARMDETNRRLDHTLALSKEAIEQWAAVVRDPSDLGALAVLDSYCYDYLKGIAHDVYLESQMWSIYF
jgi:hypothetical protein